MSGKKVVILDGSGAFDQDLAPVLGGLCDTLKEDDSKIEVFPLRDMKLAHCLGCFGCWVKTPGVCVEDDAGRQIAKAIIQSDATVLFTPLTFGGYSPDLKRMVDRFIQLLPPHFEMDHGEVHHPPRYVHRPRLMMVGVQRHPNPREVQIFKTLAGRNAINFHPPSYAAEVVLSSQEAGALRRRFEALLARSDALPYGEAAVALMPPQVDPGLAAEPSAKRVLLIVGSPKTNEPSASGSLGGYLLEGLHDRGWETESLTLRASLNREEGQHGLVSSVDQAGLILLVFPLYVDSLPFLVTKALALMAEHRRSLAQPRPQRLMVLVNSGFPENHQNAVALAICREFAAQTGMAWAGGLALGGGGAIGGEPLTSTKRTGPPVKHVIQALDLTAAALAEGRPVPAAAARMMAKGPIPLMPFALWRWMFLRIGSKGFERAAAKNGVSKKRLLDQPYAA